MRNTNPIHKACRTNDIDAVLKNINAYDVNDGDNRLNNTPLHIASHFGYVEIMKILLDKGADIEAVNDKYDTPLLVALLNHEITSVKLLLNRGANPNKENGEWISPLVIALETNIFENVELLLLHGASIDEYEGPIPDDYEEQNNEESHRWRVSYIVQDCDVRIQRIMEDYRQSQDLEIKTPDEDF